MKHWTREIVTALIIAIGLMVGIMLLSAGTGMATALITSTEHTETIEKDYLDPSMVDFTWDEPQFEPGEYPGFIGGELTRHITTENYTHRHYDITLAGNVALTTFFLLASIAIIGFYLSLANSWAGRKA